MNWKKNGLRLIGLALLILILWRFDLSAVISTILSANPWYVIAAYLLSIIIIGVKTLRWDELLRHVGIRYPLTSAFRTTFIGIFLAKFTPGALGDFARVVPLKQRGHRFGQALATCLIDRLFDVAALAFAGVLGLTLVDALFGMDLPTGWILVISIALLALCVGLILQKDILRKIIIFSFRRFVPASLKEKAKTTYQDVLRAIKGLDAKVIFWVVVWTILSWLVYFVQMQLLLGSIGVSLDLLRIAVAMAVANFVILIPITVGGLGTREATLIALLGLMGIEATSALSFSVLIIGNNLFVGLFGGLISLIKPLDVESGKED